jgi:hypothetical protein
MKARDPTKQVSVNVLVRNSQRMRFRGPWELVLGILVDLSY